VKKFFTKHAVGIQTCDSMVSSTVHSIAANYLSSTFLPYTRKFSWYVIFTVFVVGKATVKFYSMKIYVHCSRRLVSVLDRQQYHASLIIKWAWLTKETGLLQDLAKPFLVEVTATMLLNNSYLSSCVDTGQCGNV